MAVDRNISPVEQEFQGAEGALDEGGDDGAPAGTAVIDRGAQLLALVLEADAPRGLTDLAADAGLPKSTASRLLGALERHGLVEQQGQRGRFRAGPVMLRFAGRGVAGRNLAELAERPMAAFGAAQLSEDHVLEPLTSRTVVDPAVLAAELESVRNDGFAAAADELELGLTAVA